MARDITFSHGFGIFCMIFCIIDWVALSLFIQQFESSSYNGPYFIRYVVNSSYLLMIIPWYIMKRIYESKVNNSQKESKLNVRSYNPSNVNTIDPVNRSSTNGIKRPLLSKDNDNYSENPNTQHKKRFFNEMPTQTARSRLASIHGDQNEDKIKIYISTDRELVKVLCLPMIILSGFGVLSGYLFYWCLQYITTGTANTIYQSECIYVFIFSAMFLGDRVTWQKSIAIFICLIGVALISYSQDNDSSDSGTVSGVLFGLILVLSSTVMFSVLETSVNYYSNKYFRKDRKIQDTLLFQALMGFETLIIWWIVIVVLHYTNVETFIIPTKGQWGGICLTAVFDIVYQAAYFVGISLLSVFLMAMSSLLVIPLSFIGGIVFHNDGIPNEMSITGTLCIFCGFILLEVPLNKLNLNWLDWCHRVPFWWIFCGKYCCCWLSEKTRRETFASVNEKIKSINGNFNNDSNMMNVNASQTIEMSKSASGFND